MSTLKNRLTMIVAALSIIGVGSAVTGCGNSKPAETAAPGTDHVAAERQDEKDVSTVHPPSDGKTSTNPTPSNDGK